MSKPWDMARVASLRVQHRPVSRIGDDPTISDIPAWQKSGRSGGYSPSDRTCARCGFHLCTPACVKSQARLAAAHASEHRELWERRQAEQEAKRKRAHYDRVIEAYPSGFTIIHHPAQQKGRVWVDHECKVIVFNVQDLPDEEIEAATANAKRLAEESSDA